MHLIQPTISRGSAETRADRLSCGCLPLLQICVSSVNRYDIVILRSPQTSRNVLLSRYDIGIILTCPSTSREQFLLAMPRECAGFIQRHSSRRKYKKEAELIRLSVFSHLSQRYSSIPQDPASETTHPLALPTALSQPDSRSRRVFWSMLG